MSGVSPGRLSAAGAEELGCGLALTHAAGAPAFGDPSAGAAGSNHPKRDSPSRHSCEPSEGDAGEESARAAAFGSLQLPNDPAPDWPTFYGERRLRPLTGIARERGALSEAGARAVEGVCERLPELAGPAEPPARLHGDLWAGNVMADAEGSPWLVDPSAYGGHREVDLAMLRLFGAPAERVFAAYAETAPLAEGWEQRVECGSCSRCSCTRCCSAAPI